MTGTDVQRPLSLSKGLEEVGNPRPLSPSKAPEEVRDKRPLSPSKGLEEVDGQCPLSSPNDHADAGRQRPLSLSKGLEEVGGQLISLHPEAVAGTDRELRWVLPAGTLDFVGDPARVPHDVRVLLDDGTVAALTVEPDAVRIRLGTGRGWRAEGPRVRAALQAALAVPEQWSPAGDRSSDAVLAMAVRQVIDGDVGDYVRSHGGIVELLAVHDGGVEIRLSGACAHCPASELTLTERFEKAVRARFPALTSITARTPEPRPGGRRWLSLTPLLRR